jgi:hypothetical protein
MVGIGQAVNQLKTEAEITSVLAQIQQAIAQQASMTQQKLA